MVGPPGIGKTTAIIEAREVLKHVRGIKLSPSKVTPERFVNLLANSHTQLPAEEGQLVGARTASMTAMLDELSVFIRAKDFDFMTILTDLFDCPPVWEYSTLSREEDRCENVHLNIIGGITNKSIAENLGTQAFGMGFTSRIIFVTAEALEEQNDLFDHPGEPDRTVLIETLRKIHKLSGEFTITPEAREYAEDWHRRKMEPFPIDSRFLEYLPRRIMHWLKMGMLISASRRDSKEIILSDLQTAKEWLLETEAVMDKAVELVGKNPVQQAIEDTHRWMLVEFAISKKPIYEPKLINRLAHSIPLQYHGQAIKMMLETYRIAEHAGDLKNAPPNRLFVPLRLDK